MTRWAFIVLILGVACREVETVRLPLEDTTRSIVVILESEGTRSAIAFDREGGFQTSSLGEDAIAILRYEETLEALRLEKGPLDLTSGASHVRALPMTDRALVRSADDRFIEQSISDAIAELSIPELSVSECLERGGCYVSPAHCSTPSCPRALALDLRGRSTCLLDCPAVSPPEPPHVPESFAFVPVRCPDGSAGVPLESGMLCGTTRLGRCARGTMRTPGDAECVRIGTECALDGWPSELPSDRRLVFVRENAVNGDGSRVLPFGTLADAMLTSIENTAIVLAIGDYEVPGSGMELPEGASIIGACIEGTTVRGVENVFVTRAANVRVANLRIQAGGDAGLVALSSVADLTLADVEVVCETPRAMNESFGLSVEDHARVDAQSLSISGCGIGARVANSTAAFSRLSLDYPETATVSAIGLEVSDFARVELDRFHDIRGKDADRGLSIVRSSRLIGTRLAFDDSAELFIDGSDTVASFDEVAFVAPEVEDAPTAREAMRVTQGAHVSAKRVMITGHEHGVFATYGGHLEIEGLISQRNGHPVTGGETAYATIGSTVALTLALIENSREIGVRVIGGVIRLDRAVITSSIAASSGLYGIGASLASGGVLEAVDTQIEGSSSVAVYARRPNADDQAAEVRLHHVFLRGGLTVDRVRLSLSESVIVDGKGTCLFAPDSDGTIVDTVVARCGEHGIDIAAGANALSLRRVDVSAVAGTSLFLRARALTNPGFTHARHVTLRTTADAARAIALDGNTRFCMRSFAIDGPFRAGIALLSRGDMELEEGVLEGVEEGALIGDSSYDPRRLFERVQLRDVSRALGDDAEFVGGGDTSNFERICDEAFAGE